MIGAGEPFWALVSTGSIHLAFHSLVLKSPVTKLPCTHLETPFLSQTLTRQVYRVADSSSLPE